MANVYEPDFDEPREHPGFSCRRARIGHQLGTVKLGASVWELPPGQAAYPYHFHLGEEELVVVLRGTPSLRTADGWRELEEGEALSFPTGEQGAHQIVNRTDAAVSFLAVSNQQPDICVQLDSGKVGAFEHRPDGGGMRLWFREADAAGYLEGEEPPGP